MDRDAIRSDNLAHHVQRLQLGGGAGAGRLAHRRSRRPLAPAPPSKTTRSDDGASSSVATSNAPSSVARRQTDIRALMLRSFQSSDRTSFALQSAESGQSVPGFQLAFGNTLRRAAHLLAVVDEEGMVSIIDTRAAGDSHQQLQPQRLSVLQPAQCRWLAHRNAVFDVIWTHDDTHVVTASGDLFVCGWDVETQQSAFRLQGHQMSVKCVRQVPEHDQLFASGARDGNVLLWDTRASAKPVATLQDVHTAAEPARAPFTSPPSARKRKKPVASNAPRSVTCIEFGAQGHELVTAGAIDSVVKFWDVRRLTTSHHFKATAFSSRPVRSVSCASRASACHGIASLAFDHTKSKLLVSVLNDAVNVIDIHATPQTPPLVQCTGHLATSFYVKAAFSPESDFIVGGSADGAAFIWRATTASAGATAHTRLPCVALKGHLSEVNGVAWHRHDFTTLASCSDDGSVRSWRIDRATETSSDVSRAFELERQDDDQSWRNWSDFCAQPDGRAYAIAPSSVPATDQEVESMDVDDGDTAKFRSPFLVRRSTELLRRRADVAQPTPPRRPAPSPPQTLLDFWRR